MTRSERLQSNRYVTVNVTKNLMCNLVIVSSHQSSILDYRPHPGVYNLYFLAGELTIALSDKFPRRGLFLWASKEGTFLSHHYAKVSPGYARVKSNSRDRP